MCVYVIYIYICIYIYLCKTMLTHKSMYRHTHFCACTYGTPVCMCINLHTYIHTYIHPGIQAGRQAGIYKHVIPCIFCLVSFSIYLSVYRAVCPSAYLSMHIGFRFFRVSAPDSSHALPRKDLPCEGGGSREWRRLGSPAVGPRAPGFSAQAWEWFRV